MEINGSYNLKTKRNTFSNCECWKLDGEDCSARILCHEKYSDPCEIVKYVTKNKARGKLDEDGLFMAVVFYNGNLYIFADASTSQWVMYYTVVGNKLFYSTSLKKLLKDSDIPRKINVTSAKGFLKNGIVLGRHTLMEGVYKLDVCEMLFVKNHSVQRKRITYKSTKYREDYDLLDVLKTSIKRFAAQNKKVFMPLSAGYDSNMILHTLTQDGHTIEAFTIGGKTGKNEIPLVEKNISFYHNITHHTELADQSLFCKLPEIIWRLDGYVYERGIFLQYLLADLVARNGGRFLICGECSDEHQSLLYQKDRMREQRHTVSSLESLDWMLEPYAWGNFVVLKKSALMLNSFGIQGCYPFATKRFTDIAVSLGQKNLDKKALFIDLLKDELPREIYDGIFHAGGATSVHSVLSEKDRTAIKEAISKSDLIKEAVGDTECCYKPFWLNYAELFLMNKGKNNGCVKIGFAKYLLKELLSSIRLLLKKSDPLDDSLESEIKAYYLILFSELFISQNTSLLQNTP